MSGGAVLFSRKLALFILLNLVVLGLGDAAVLHAASIYKDGASIICETKRQSVRDGRLGGKQGAPNVVILGDSRVLAGVIPEVFDNAVGRAMHSTNLALPALPIGPDLYVLRDYVERNGAPAFVVLRLRSAVEGSVFFDLYANQGSTLPEVLSYAFERRETSILLYRFNPIAMYDSQFRSWLGDALLRPGAVDALRASNETRVSQMLLDRGYYNIREQQLFPGGRLPDDYDTGPAPAETPFDLEDDPYVPAFFEYTRKLGIRVLLVEVPSRKLPVAERTEMPAYYHAALERYPNVHMAREGWRQKKYPNRLFSDVTHMNPEGARIFTKRVAEEFVEVFGSEF
jgi:hypothetical protein